jgi:hypothetical protein
MASTSVCSVFYISHGPTSHDLLFLFFRSGGIASVMGGGPVDAAAAPKERTEVHFMLFPHETLGSVQRSPPSSRVPHRQMNS